METEITIFNSPRFGDIHTTGTSEEPLFCLADVCRVLGLKRFRSSERLSKDVISNHPLKTNGGIQQVIFVNEDGLYDVILDSRKPEAKAFRKWITSEVLPTIRKTGGYMVGIENETPEQLLARALLVAQDTVNRMQQKLQQKDEQLAISEPKVEYYDEVLSSDSTFTTTQVAQDFGLSAIALNKKLNEMGILYKQSGQWLLTAKYKDMNLVKSRTHPYMKSDGTIGTKLLTVWTEKGRKFIYDLFSDKIADL